MFSLNKSNLPENVETNISIPPYKFKNYPHSTFVIPSLIFLDTLNSLSEYISILPSYLTTNKSVFPVLKKSIGFKQTILSTFIVNNIVAFSIPISAAIIVPSSNP